MCEIKITISAPELASAIKSLADALSAHSVENTSGLTLREEPLKAPVEPEKPEVEKLAEPTEKKPAEAEKQAVNVAEAPKAKEYTITELSKAGAALCEQGKMSQLINLLKGFGVQALTQVPKDKYGELAAGLISLGAQL